ncbi:hypothetical protein RI367_003286 [Sorochytrium milnesiophthora]
MPSATQVRAQSGRSARSPVQSEEDVAIDEDIATMEELEQYIELLYEELPEKLRCARLILQLARDADHIDALANNESLMSALSRTLREDSKKSLELITNIAQIFFLFSQYSRFHPLLMANKIGDMSLKLIDQEMMRVKVWQENVDKAKEKYQASAGNPSALREYEGETRKLRSLMAKQDYLLYAIVHLLLNMAEDLPIEIKMIKRGMVGHLVKLARTRESQDVQLVVIRFLKKLCIFNENKDELLSQSQAFCQAATKILQSPNKQTVTRSMLQLLVNLSHDAEFRNEFVKSGLVAKLVDQLQADTGSVPIEVLMLLYQISTEDKSKAIFMYTDALPLLLKHILECKTDRVEPELICLVINLCCNVHNAEMFCENGALKFLVKRVIRTRDPLLMRLLRTIAQHDLHIKLLFLEFIDDIMHLFVASAAADADLTVEMLGLLGNLAIADFDYAKLAETYGIVPFLAQVLAMVVAQQHGKPQFPLALEMQATLAGKAGRGPVLMPGTLIEDDYVLEAVNVCGTFALDEGMDALWVEHGVCDLLIQVMAIYEDDDEMTLQLLYCFYHMMLHERTQEKLLNETQLVSFLVDLLYDRNLEIRRMCDLCLDIVSDISEVWQSKIRAEKFHMHNAQWVAASVKAGQRQGGGRQSFHFDEHDRIRVHSSDVPLNGEADGEDQPDDDQDDEGEDEEDDEDLYGRQPLAAYQGIEAL